MNHETIPPKLPDAKLEHYVGAEPVGSDPNEEGSAGRVTVRLTRLGIRLLDADNLCGGVKFLLDACRYEGLIPEDNPGAICLIVRQRKVKRVDTGTILEIY
jgi:hypothetical protein